VVAATNFNQGEKPAVTATYTPQQIADFLIKHGLAGLDLLKRVPAPGLVGPASPAMGPEDELSPFARTLRSGVGTVGPAAVPPISYLSSRYANPLGNGMDDWKSSAEGYSQRPAQPATSPQEPGGLLGIVQDYLRKRSG